MNWFWFLNFYIKISKRHVYTLYAHASTRPLLLSTRPRSCSRADPGPARRARAPLKIFINFDCITRINFHCSHHTVLTICTLFSTVTKKQRVCVKVSSKQTPDAKNSGTAPLSESSTFGNVLLNDIYCLFLRVKRDHVISNDEKSIDL